MFEMASVDEYHASSFWMFRRHKYLADHPEARCLCGRSDVQLHHLDYRHLGEEPNDDLLPLCADHHYEVEKHIGRSPLDRRAATIEYVEQWRARKEGSHIRDPRSLDMFGFLRELRGEPEAQMPSGSKLVGR